MAHFYDTHAHLDYPDFVPDLPQVVERALAAGITKIISIGTNIESSRKAIQLADRFGCVYAVVGWHPSDAMKAPKDIREELRDLARHPKVVALGETGLDYHRLAAHEADVEKSRQADLFRQHLEIAAELELNCVIHQRDSLEDTLAQLQPFADRVRGVFHCFVDNVQAMKRILEMNSIVSFTGVATFKNAQTVRDTLAATPLGAFMLETDSPFLAPMPYRGKRCEPAYVKELSGLVAKVKVCSLDELSEATCSTAHKFFPKLR